MAENEQVAAQAQAANLNVMNVNELKTLFSNPKSDISIFYGDQTKDSITAQFIAGNFKLALSKKANITLWSRIEPQFKSHYDIQNTNFLASRLPSLPTPD
jgi:hypothetical protein